MIKRFSPFASLVVLAIIAVLIALVPQLSIKVQAAVPTSTSTAMPGADFAASPLSGSAPLTVHFTALNRSILMSCTWRFGDGASRSFAPAPGTSMYFCPSTDHTYTSGGSYSVTLIVTKVTGRGNSLTKANYIQVGPVSATSTFTPTSTPTPTFTPTGSLPDLVVSSLSWTPSNAQLGSTVQFSAVVSNIGAGATPDGVIQDVCFTITSGLTTPNTICSTSRTASIPAGGSVTLQANQTWTITVDTNYNIQAAADYGARIAESNESNNSLSKVMNSKSTPAYTYTPSRTYTPSSTPSVSATSTPTPTGTVDTCSPVNTQITTAPYIFDGAGSSLCWQASTLGSYINSWNLTSLTINGVDITNKYVPASSYPPRINGYWYIVYNGPYAWSHFETK